MKHKLILSLLLIIVICLTSCSQNAPASDTVSAETPSAEQTADIPEATETPAPTEDEVQATETVTQEEQPQEQEQKQETQTPVEETASESEEAPEKDEGQDIEVEDEISAYQKMLEDETLSDEERSVLEHYIGYLKESEEDVNGETETPTVTEKPAGEYVPPVTRTDEEVKAALDNYVDNFKNTSTFANLTGVAAEHIDELLDTVKNNPESNDSLKTIITMYKDGVYSEEEFLYCIEGWIKIGGPYGSRVIVSG